MKRRASSFSRAGSNSFEREVPAVDGSRGSARYCKKYRGERASAMRDRKERIKARETGQTSCYILEEHFELRHEKRSPQC